MREPILKVAMISFHTCPLATLGGKDTGGMNVYVRELTHHLGRKCVHVDVFTRSQDEHIPTVLHDLGYGNRVVHIPAGPEIPMPKQEIASHIPEFAAGVLAFCREKRLGYDLIHSHYWMSGVAAQVLQKKWKTPIINMFHTLGLVKNQVARSKAEIEGNYRLDGERKVLQAADRIVAATPAEKEQLVNLYGADESKLKIIPPGVDTCHFYPIPADEAKEVIGIPPEDRMLLYVGRIEPLKGVEILIRAIAHMHGTGILEKCPHRLAIIGGDPDLPSEVMNTEMARLQGLCNELGLGDLVVFLGKRSQDTLPYYYSAAEMVVVPSYYESFGMVALEAMACGTPVVASQVGGLAHLVQDDVNGYVVSDGDPIALGNCLMKLICEQETRERLGKQANIYAQAYDWENISGQILSLYQKVVN